VLTESPNIVVTESAYPYLVAQVGAISDMRDDWQLWCRAYVDTLTSLYESIAPFLPKTCDAILDVGSGLGGINILLNEHYGGKCHVSLLDGVNDPPEVTLHSKTFSNSNVARDFLKLNGVEDLAFIDANSAKMSAPRYYDLVVSFKSWCFHYEPSRYLDFVKECTVPGSTIIVDVRGGLKACQMGYDWQRELSAAFKRPMSIHFGGKFETMRYTVA
jgi:SAM-dependent methyltransferase